ncbi:MAG: hypothetical protein B7Z53_02090, partial [Rhodospirillales bacterium 12-71-4]
MLPARPPAAGLPPPSPGRRAVRAAPPWPALPAGPAAGQGRGRAWLFRRLRQGLPRGLPRRQHRLQRQRHRRLAGLDHRDAAGLLHR